MENSRILPAAMLIVASEIFLVLSGMVIKQLTGELPLELIVFFRNFFGISLLLPWLMRQGVSSIATEKLRFHFMRGAVGVTAMSCLYYSWQYLPLAEAALLKQTAPFFIPLIAFWWLGEKIPVLARWAILVGFIGVFLILNPAEGELNIAVLIAVIGAMLGATAKVTVRRMSYTEPPQRIVFYFALFGFLISAVPAALSWQMPTLAQAGWLFMMAITSTCAQLLLSKAYGMAPAGQLGPFTYASVGFAALAGWIFWNEYLAWTSWLGILLIVGAGIMALQKRSKGKDSGVRGQA